MKESKKRYVIKIFGYSAKSRNFFRLNVHYAKYEATGTRTQSKHSMHRLTNIQPTDKFPIFSGLFALVIRELVFCLFVFVIVHLACETLSLPFRVLVNIIVKKVKFLLLM